MVILFNNVASAPNKGLNASVILTEEISYGDEGVGLSFKIDWIYPNPSCPASTQFKKEENIMNKDLN